MKTITMAVLFTASLATVAQAETYTFDPDHTEIRFYYNHAGLTEQSGEWLAFEGEVEFDAEDIAATKVTLTIDPSGIHTGVKALDEHLMSGDFFDAANNQEIIFESTDVVQSGVKTVQLTGNLRIKDTTAPIILNVDLTHQGPHPLAVFGEAYSGEWIGVEAEAQILRSTYGVGMFAPVTSDEVRLEISAELKAGN